MNGNGYKKKFSKNENYNKKEKIFIAKLDSIFDIKKVSSTLVKKVIQLEQPKNELSSSSRSSSQQTEVYKKHNNLEQLENELPTTSRSNIQQTDFITESKSCQNKLSEDTTSEVVTSDTETLPIQPKKRRGRENIITPKLAAVLDRCKLSVRDSVFVIEATAEALGYNIETVNINKSSINRQRLNFRRAQAETIKEMFKNGIPNYVTVHWDGKLIAAPNVRDKPIERLPIPVTSKYIEQLLGIPKISRSTGKILIYNK